MAAMQTWTDSLRTVVLSTPGSIDTVALLVFPDDLEPAHQPERVGPTCMSLDRHWKVRLNRRITLLST